MGIIDPSEMELFARMVTGRDTRGNTDLLSQVEKRLRETSGEVVRIEGKKGILSEQLSKIDAELAQASDSRDMWEQMLQLAGGRPLPRPVARPGAEAMTAPSRYSSATEMVRGQLNLDEAPAVSQAPVAASPATPVPARVMQSFAAVSVPASAPVESDLADLTVPAVAVETAPTATVAAPANTTPIPIHGVRQAPTWKIPATRGGPGRVARKATEPSAPRTRKQRHQPPEVEEFVTWYKLVREEFGEYPPDGVAGEYFDVSSATISRVRAEAVQARLLTFRKADVGVGKRWKARGGTLAAINERFGAYR